jgi:hypothetical protein
MWLIITAFLKRIPAKDWLYLAVIAALGTAFGIYTAHERDVGKAEVIAADKAATLKAQAAAQKETDRLQAKANEAEHSHDQELMDLRAYRDSNPVHVGVCNHTDSKPVLPVSSPSDTRNAGGSTPSGDVQPVPAGDSKSADIGPMLDLLAGKADAVSAELREFQKR